MKLRVVLGTLLAGLIYATVASGCSDDAQARCEDDICPGIEECGNTCSCGGDDGGQDCSNEDEILDALEDCSNQPCDQQLGCFLTLPACES